MSNFTTPLIVTPLADGRHWVVIRKFEYHVGSKYSNNVVRVPPDFVTDFASSPWFAWWAIPSWGKYGKAAIIHDFLYQHKYMNREVSEIVSQIPVTRKRADDIFKEAMIVLGVKKWRIFLMYWGVRLFGWLAWR